MAKIKLIYDVCASWEKDYIMELFNKINYDIISVIPEVLKDKLDEEDKIINNNILVFSSNVYTFDQILNIVLRIKPIIIVHLSDEWGNKPEYTKLASYTKLLLHQYHFNNYPYDNYNNIIQIPLGYMKGMFDNKNALNFKIKPIIERKYNWSFVGKMKSDRKKMIDKFSKKINKNFVGNNINVLDMFNIYNNTIFVPNGRGNVSLDCFRIYETILSGSIPIIVCDEHEFNNTFYYNNDIPPFILEKTWDNAIDKCNYLLKNIEELENIQKKNYEWLKNKIESIQNIIYSKIKHDKIFIHSNINNLRLGYTETTLLFYYYLDSLKANNSSYKKSQNKLINWLFSTSGFYDKNIVGSYFNFDAKKIKKSDVYNSYFNKLLKIVKNKNTHLQLCFHNISSSLLEYKENFLKYIDYYHKPPNPNILRFMDNKNILIINNLGILMKQQYESGNIKKICPEFSDSVKSIKYLHNGYSFLNNGPDSSILETSENLCNQIRTIDFDGAIISAGAYSSLLFDFIVSTLKKKVYVIGGELPLYFGIITKRSTIENYSDKIHEYLISVPSEMKPLNYKKIEGGTYW